MNNKYLKINFLGKYGGLSSGLKNIFDEINPNYEINKSLSTDIELIKIATFCPTLRSDNEENYLKELEYYKELINNMKEKEHLIYISSITLELTNKTFYSRAKKSVEEMLYSNLKNYTIFRLGMIFNAKTNRFTLSSMEQSSKSIFTFQNDIPKTTACTIKDIYQSILKVGLNLHFYSGKKINIGIKRFKFSELQNFSNYKKFRIPLLSFFMLKILSLLSPRLRAYVGGKASSDVPNIAFKSSMDIN